jgi:hypothetical protein
VNLKNKVRSAKVSGQAKSGQAKVSGQVKSGHSQAKVSGHIRSVSLYTFTRRRHHIMNTWV